MDINSFQRKDSASVEIQDPLGAKTDITVVVYGRDSKAYRKAAIELARDFDVTDEGQASDRGAKLLQSCIVSWKNVEADGKAVKHDSPEALAMLKDENLDWFVSQINAAIQKRSLFFSKSVKS
jgi:hypothetical protein